MTVYHRFKPEQFALDPHAGGFQLDPDVAAVIANTVYADDPATHNGNNWGEPSLIIDPTGETITHGVARENEANTGGDENYRVSLEAGETGVINQLFAREVRAAFLNTERRNKLDWKVSLGIMGVAGTGLDGALIDFLLHTGLPVSAKADLVVTSTAVIALTLKPKIKRLSVLRPGSWLNERHLKAAEKIATTLELPPVISPC